MLIWIKYCLYIKSICNEMPMIQRRYLYNVNMYSDILIPCLVVICVRATEENCLRFFIGFTRQNVINLLTGTFFLKRSVVMNKRQMWRWAYQRRLLVTSDFYTTYESHKICKRAPYHMKRSEVKKSSLML